MTIPIDPSGDHASTSPTVLVLHYEINRIIMRYERAQGKGAHEVGKM